MEFKFLEENEDSLMQKLEKANIEDLLYEELIRTKAIYARNFDYIEKSKNPAYIY